MRGSLLPLLLALSLTPAISQALKAQEALLPDTAESGAEAETAEFVMGAEIPRALTTAEAVLDAYIEANSGRKGLEAVRSLRMRGRVEERGQNMSIALVKKRPNYKRLTMEQGAVHFTVSSDGKTGWKQTRANGQSKVEALSPEDLSNMVSDGDFDGPLVDGGPGILETKLVGTGRLGRTPCYVIEIVRESDTTRYILDARSFRELRSISTTKLPDGSEAVVESRMYDYTRAGGIWVAQRIERWVKGERISRLTIDSIEVNPGVLDSYFTEPTS